MYIRQNRWNLFKAMWKSEDYSTWELWILRRGLRVLSPIVSCQPTILLVCFKVLSCHLQRYRDACAIITVPVCQARLCVCVPSCRSNIPSWVVFQLSLNQNHAGDYDQLPMTLFFLLKAFLLMALNKAMEGWNLAFTEIPSCFFCSLRSLWLA